MIRAFINLLLLLNPLLLLAQTTLLILIHPNKIKAGGNGLLPKTVLKKNSWRGWSPGAQANPLGFKNNHLCEHGVESHQRSNFWVVFELLTILYLKVWHWFSGLNAIWACGYHLDLSQSMELGHAWLQITQHQIFSLKRVSIFWGTQF